MILAAWRTSITALDNMDAKQAASSIRLAVPLEQLRTNSISGTGASISVIREISDNKSGFRGNISGESRVSDSFQRPMITENTPK